MKKHSCSFFSILLIVLCFLPVHIKAEETQDNLDRTVFYHLLSTDQYHAESNYYVGAPIKIIEGEENDDTVSVRRGNAGLIYLVFENSSLVILAYCVEDTIKVTDVVNASFIDAVEKNHKVTAIDVNGFLYLCYDNTVICVNGNADNTDKVVNLAKTIEEDRSSNRRKLVFGDKGGLSNTINLPTRGQSPYYIGCWAACIASFDSYYNNHNTTVSNVVYTVTGSYNQVLGKTVSQVQSYLSTYYSISTSQRSINSNFCSNARTDLDANKAYILEWKQTLYDSLTGTTSIGYHYTVLKGYNYSAGSYYYYIMDPYHNSSMSGGTYTLSTASSTSFPNNTYMYGGGTCTLYASLHKN